jgi:hypothetical protein
MSEGAKVKELPLFYFFRDSLSWGFKLGFLTGFPYWAFLWPYGPFGILINMIFGTILGGINGIALSFIAVKYSEKYVLLITFVVTLIISCSLYFFVFLSYNNSRPIGALIYAMFPSTINAIIAGYMLQRAARLYKTGKLKDNDQFSKV